MKHRKNKKKHSLAKSQHENLLKELQQQILVAVQHHQAGRLKQAEAIYSHVLELKPDHADALHLSGLAAHHAGQHQKAIHLILQAIQVSPKVSMFFYNLGAAYHAMSCFEEAIQSYQKALDLNPDYAEVYSNLGNSYKSLGKMDEAISSYQKAIQLKPDFADAYNNLGVVLQFQGKIHEALSFYNTVMKIQPDNASVHSTMLFVMHYLQWEDGKALFQQHRVWDACHGSGKIGISEKRTVVRNHFDRINVGYISPDFKEHSVSYFIEPILKAHDAGRFNVVCYSDTPISDAVTLRLKGLGRKWRDTFGFSDEKMIDLIRADGIHILVDLAGHTAYNRLPLFVRKPAPIQVTYLGYPNTTGLAAMDYRISDTIADPPGLAERWHTEKLVYLPGGFLCYQPPMTAPEISELPAKRTDNLTFASFNNRSKITEQVIHTWAQILKSIPGSRLILKSQALEDAKTIQQLMHRFEDRQVDPGRIELHGFLPADSHLELYHRVDIALDTFPYNGTTTTCEALWMGVPVIVLDGNAHVSRVGVSLLSTIGLDAFIANSVDDYIHKAVSWGQNVKTLSSLRSGLREMMRKSMLMDTHAFTRSLEQAYESMVATWL